MNGTMDPFMEYVHEACQQGEHYGWCELQLGVVIRRSCRGQANDLLSHLRSLAQYNIYSQLQILGEWGETFEALLKRKRTVFKNVKVFLQSIFSQAQVHKKLSEYWHKYTNAKNGKKY